MQALAFQIVSFNTIHISMLSLREIAKNCIAWSNAHAVMSMTQLQSEHCNFICQRFVDVSLTKVSILPVI